MQRLLLGAVVLLFASSCCLGPKVTVVKNPGECEEGIRYYRPKPYLFITAAGSKKEEEEGGKTTTTTIQGGSPEAVQIQLQYLPDYSEEYSIQVDPGIGVANVDLTLEDGWNLTGINQQLDSKTAENVKSIADLTSAVGGAVKSSGKAAKEDGAKYVVAATNVPLGYYESVIGCDNSGRKRLFGWRYLGFMPYSTCPIDMYGSDCRQCGESLYGLVFENGVMTFKTLDVAAIGDVTRVIERGHESASPPKQSENETESEEHRLLEEIRTEAAKESIRQGGTGNVDTWVSGDAVVLEVDDVDSKRSEVGAGMISSPTFTDSLKSIGKRPLLRWRKPAE